MRNTPGLYKLFRDQQGVTMILFTLAIFVLIGFAALAIDIGHLFVVRNELKNAADAAALAGARVLYNNNGTAVNEGANQVAFEAATANRSEKVAVDVNNWSDNTGDVERGHWSFATGEFNASPSLEPVDLWNVSTAVLDAWDPLHPFINAVRVTTRREATPAASFFARIFGFQNFFLSARSVAYIGFVGSIEPEAVDQPIAICRQSIEDNNGNYTCGVGRMINSGSNAGHQTGGWSNFTQPCQTASASSIKPLVCGEGNPNPIVFGQGMGTTGGQVQVAFNSMISCWKNQAGLDSNPIDGWPDRPWILTLPVIDCPGNNTSNCSQVVGVVTLNILWITNTDKNQYKEVPRYMEVTMDGVTTTFSCPKPTSGQQCWNQFVTTFHLQDVLNNSPAFYEDKTIYFLPDCNPHIPTGVTGGHNFGILAKIPVLVQ